MVITKATMSLYNYYDMWPTYLNGPRTLFKLTKQWSQKEASWDKASASTTWAKKGGDYNTSPVAKLKDTNFVQWEHFDVTQAIIDFQKSPSSNYGFLLKFDSYTPNHNVLYVSSEDKDSVQNRPKLTITIEETTGIGHARVSENNRIRIAQNNGLVKLFLPFSGNTQVIITDMRGKRVATFTVSANNGWISMPGAISSGMHIFTVQNADKKITTKTLITR